MYSDWNQTGLSPIKCTDTYKMYGIQRGGIDECLLMFLPKHFDFRPIITNLLLKMLGLFPLLFLSDFDLTLLKHACTGSNYIPVPPSSLIVCRLNR